MKFAVAFIGLIALCSAHPQSNFGLREDLNDFLTLIPVDEITAIVVEYIANDKEVQDALNFVLSTEFTSVVAKVEATPQIKTLIKDLDAAGLDATGFVNALNDFLGLPPYKPMKKAIGGKSMRDMIDKIKDLIPEDKLLAMYNDKLKTSPDFKKLVDYLKSSEFKKVVSDVVSDPMYKDMIKRACDHKIDVNAIIRVLNDLLEWGIKMETCNI